MREYLIISSALMAVVSWLLAASTLSARPLTRSNIAYGGFFLSSALWATLYVLWLIADDVETALEFCRWLMVPAGFVGPFYYHWNRLCSGPARSPKGEFVIFGMYAIAGIHALLALETDLVVATVEPMFGLPYWPIAGPAFSLFVLTYFVGLVGTALKQLPRSSATSGSGLRGSRHVVSSIYLVGTLCGATNVPGWYRLDIPPFGQGMLAAFVVVQAYIGTQRANNTIRIDFVTSAVWALVLVAFALLLSAIMPSFVSLIELPIMVFLAVLVTGCLTLLVHMRMKWLVEELRIMVGIDSTTVAKQIRRLALGVHKLSAHEMAAEGSARIASELGCGRVALFWRPAGSGTARLIAKYGGRQFAVLELEPDDRVCLESAREAGPWLVKSLQPKAESWLAEYDICIPVLNAEQLNFAILIGQRERGLGYTESEIGALQVLAGSFSETLVNRAQLEREARHQQLVHAGKLAAGIAHNIRNPLAVVRAYLEADPTLSPEVTADLHRVALSEIARIHSTVDGLSALSRGEKFTLSPCDLSALVGQVIELQRDYLTECRATLKVAIEPRQFYVLAEANQFANALSNLVRNAAEELVRCGDGGRIEIDVTEATSEWVTLRVTDSGRGLPSYIRDAVFSKDLFAKTTKTSGATGRRTGFGIGLHSSMLIITTGHGGQFDYVDGSFLIRLMAAPRPEGLIA